MSDEIRQEEVVCLRRYCAATLEKQSHMSQKTVGSGIGEKEGYVMRKFVSICDEFEAKVVFYECNVIGTSLLEEEE